MIEMIDTLLNYKCTVTMYDFNDKPLLFCLGIDVSEPKEIWHIANLCRDQGFDMGSPQYDEKAGCLYFPRLVLDESMFDYIAKVYNV